MKFKLLVAPLLVLPALVACGGSSGDKPWYADSNYIKGLKETDVGKTTKTLKVNGVDHEVRLIGVDQDKDAKGNTIHTTWEFANLLSDSNGYSLATYWNDVATSDDSNYNYMDSSIRRALTGEGKGEFHWFEKEATKYSTAYTKSVVEMLPADFVESLKIADKKINIYNSGSSNWEEQHLSDKLFLLTSGEMGWVPVKNEKRSPDAYKFYDYDLEEEMADLKVACVKHQVKGKEGAIYGSTSSIEGKFDDTKYSYAGYDAEAAPEPEEPDGSPYWLRSPLTEGNEKAERIKSDGESGEYKVYMEANPIAPAFCL